MKRLNIALSLSLLTACAVLAWFAHQASVADEPESEQDTAAAEETTQETNVEVTDDWRRYNSDKYAKPKSKFNKGHVTPRELDGKSLAATENGFTVSFPAGAPIPTPTFYKGKLYVSGGFNSKEFYCLDAKSGKLAWGLNLDDDGPSSAVVQDGVVVFNTESCTIFAVDAETGKLLWSHWLGDPLMSTPTIANGKVFTAYPAGGGGGGGYGQQGFYNPAANSPAVNSAPAESNENDDESNASESDADDSNTNDDESQVEQQDPLPAPLPPQAPIQNQIQQVQQQAVPAAQVPQAGQDADGKKYPPATHVAIALDLQTGEIVWQRWIDSDVMSAPVAHGDEVVIASFAGNVYRFRQNDGHIISVRKERATSAPVIRGDDFFFTRRSDKEGKQAEEGIARNDAKSNRAIFLANKNPAPHLDKTVQQRAGLAQKGQQADALNGFAGGAPLAANPAAALENIGQMSVYTCQTFQGSRLLNWGDRNYNCQGDEVFCTDAKTGEKEWSFKLKGDLKKVGGSLASPPAMAGGKIFLAMFDGRIIQIDPKQGKTEKTYSIGHATRSQPVIVDGRIYIGTDDGKIVCINTGNQKLTGWTTWGGNPAHTGKVE